MVEAKTRKVAFVVVGWNNEGLLKDCFDSINGQTQVSAVIVYIDNNSSDQSVGFVGKHFPNVKMLALSRNTGFAKGNNIGIKEALKDSDVEYVALLNTDARLDSQWARTIIDFAGSKPLGACYQGTTLDYFDHNIIDSTHTYIARNGQGTQANWRQFVDVEKGPRKVYGVNAAACIYSRSFIEAQPFGSEFFDETMFMYLEDVDVASRATIMGWDNYLVPGAQAYHMGSVSSNKRPGFSLYMTFRNNAAVLFKNFPIRLIIRMLPRIVRGDIDTLRTLWRRKQKRAIWMVVKGRLVGIFRLPLFLVKRLKMRKSSQTVTDYVWYLMDKGW